MPPTLNSYYPAYKYAVWAAPCSLATTKGMAVKTVCFLFPPLTMMIRFSGFAIRNKTDCFDLIAKTGCPIGKSPVHRLLSTSPRLIAATLRPSSLLVSRHPLSAPK